MLINKRYHVKALPKLHTKLIVPRESTAEEVSIKWSHHRISSTDYKVRTTLEESPWKRKSHSEMSGKGVPMQNCVFSYLINLAVICISADVFPIRIFVLLWSSKLTAPRTRMTLLNYFLRDGQKSTCLISAIGCWVEGKNSVHEFSVFSSFLLSLSSFLKRTLSVVWVSMSRWRKV